MAITSLGQKRSGDAAIRKNGKRLVYEETYEYIISSGDDVVTRFAILSSPIVPKVNVSVGGGGFTICNSVECTRRESNPRIWDVTATFSSDIEEDSSGANENESGDPTAWTPLAELAFETFTEVSFTDADGDPFQNSANYVFPSGIPLTRTLTKYDFDQFEPSTVTAKDIAERNETVNSVAFGGNATKTLRLKVRRATIGYYYGFRVWRIGYSLTFKPDTWQYKISDVGPWFLSGTDRVPFRDSEGNRIIGNLNGSGAAATTASIINFDKFEAIDFNDFLRVNLNG
jgi:hypothetical protein